MESFYMFRVLFSVLCIFLWQIYGMDIYNIGFETIWVASSRLCYIISRQTDQPIFTMHVTNSPLFLI